MIAITGAAGFIGANLSRRLEAMLPPAGRLLLVDYPSTRGQSRNFEGLRPFHFLGHLEFLDELDRDPSAVEAIFHLGACSDTTEADWEFLRENNVEYSKHLWHWCARRGIPFIYASSAATYGDGSLGFDDRTPPAQLSPLNLYGKGKNEFDRWVLDEVDRGGPAPRGWAGLKFFNVYGPREGHKGRMASMVWQAYRQIVERGEVALFRSSDRNYPDGGQLRDFVYVEDNLDHMTWLWHHPEVCGIFNSGTGQERSFLDLVHATFLALDLPPEVRFVEMPEDLRGRYQNFTRAETGKLADAGYPGRPTSLEEGVSRYVGWLRDDPGPATTGGPGRENASTA